MTSKEKKNARSNEYKKTHIKEVIIAKIKFRAKKHKILFDIAPEDIKIPKRCPVLGIPLVYGRETGNDNSPSVDRINPNKGYIKGNIQVISVKANRMKNNATKAELRKFAKRIDKFINNK